jgi:hypothetical protein
LIGGTGWWTVRCTPESALRPLYDFAAYFRSFMRMLHFKTVNTA